MSKVIFSTFGRARRYSVEFCIGEAWYDSGYSYSFEWVAVQAARRFAAKGRPARVIDNFSELEGYA